MRGHAAWLLVAALLPALPACSRPSSEAATAQPVEIRGLPAFPGATELVHESHAGHWGYHHGSAGRLMATSAPLAEVKAFYEKVIAEQGWTVILATESHGGFHWHLYQGSSLGDIELAPRPDGRVEIHLERHDH